MSIFSGNPSMVLFWDRYLYVYVFWVLTHSSDPYRSNRGCVVTCVRVVFFIGGRVNTMPCWVCTDDRIGDLIADSVAPEWVL
jgi:hypothetical protein